MKEYQVLISGILIAAAIYLGLTYTEPTTDKFGGIRVPDSAHDTDFEACMQLETRLKKFNGEHQTYGQAFDNCTTNNAEL